MKQLFDINFLLPIGILLIQASILLAICIYVLRKMGVISFPVGGIEYSQSIFAAACLISLFFIFTSVISATFQASGTYNAQNFPILKSLVGKSGQFFLVLLLFEALLGAMVFLATRLLLGIGNFMEELNNGNIPFSIFVAAISIGFSIVLQHMSKEAIELITPRYFNFR